VVTFQHYIDPLYNFMNNCHLKFRFTINNATFVNLIDFYNFLIMVSLQIKIAALLPVGLVGMAFTAISPTLLQTAPHVKLMEARCVFKVYVR